MNGSPRDVTGCLLPLEIQNNSNSYILVTNLTLHLADWNIIRHHDMHVLGWCTYQVRVGDILEIIRRKNIHQSSMEMYTYEETMAITT
ncbi:hypothetical protein H5410_058462 [Solanum commersonii]|uniref:Uncharacterized protein n=1 Tax=Solanum commersonii TaxID=4109 RepID=A0A9J5WTK6_SOLCO|nr:hypothetical protein H5410_058462 [Solanum commersonii]